MVGKIKYRDVLNCFRASFVDRHIIPEELEYQWFLNAVGEYSMEVGELEYDDILKEFTVPIPQIVMNILGAIMKRQYLEREVARVNKLNNIIGKDLKLNGSGDTKKYTMQELNMTNDKIRNWINKQKTSAYL